MSAGRWKIHLEKDSLKFSATHMTLFPNGTKEGLHGHNYQVALTVELNDASFPTMIDFSVFKTLIKELCSEWDERILMPLNNPGLTLHRQSDGQELEFRYRNKKRYVLPSDEVILLPLENITSELLARELAEHLWKALQTTGLLEESHRQTIESVEVYLEETRGQGASYIRKSSG